MDNWSILSLLTPADLSESSFKWALELAGGDADETTIYYCAEGLDVIVKLLHNQFHCGYEKLPEPFFPSRHSWALVGDSVFVKSWLEW